MLRSLLIVLLLISPALADINAWPETQYALTGVNILSDSDGLLLVSQDSKPAVKSVGVVYVAENGNVRVEAEDASRNALEVKPLSPTADGTRAWVIYGTGKVWIRVELIDFETQRWEVKKLEFVIAGTTPPTPGPNPVDPVDPLTPSPFPGQGLQVLIVYELDEVPLYSPATTETLYSKQLRVWANANCLKDASGTAGLRIFDKDTTSDTPNQWTDALKRPRLQLPWIVIGNGTTGYEGPLPPTLAETIALMETFK